MIHHQISQPVIKVCGITSPEQAKAVVAEGATMLGLLLGLVIPSKDEVTVLQAKEICQAVGHQACTTMVTELQTAEQIIPLAKNAGIGAIQLHDGLPEPEIKALRDALPHIPLIGVVHVSGEDSYHCAVEIASLFDFLLLDSRTDDLLGGTGKTHDWALSRRIVETIDTPVILAGGLNPENITAAITQVSPAGIDAYSCFLRPDGGKDMRKIAAFVDAGKSAIALF